MVILVYKLINAEYIGECLSLHFPDITNDLHFREHILLSNRKNPSLLSNIHELIEKTNLESPLDTTEPCIIRQHRKPPMYNIEKT